jgi:hypothetical protein
MCFFYDAFVVLGEITLQSYGANPLFTELLVVILNTPSISLSLSSSQERERDRERESVRVVGMIYKELRKQKIEQLEIAAVLLVFKERERERERERWILCFLTWLLHFPNPWWSSP